MRGLCTFLRGIMTRWRIEPIFPRCFVRAVETQNGAMLR